MDSSVIFTHLVTDTLLPAGTPYLSLSHFSREEEFLTLVWAKLDQVQMAISIVELTALFRGALYVLVSNLFVFLDLKKVTLRIYVTKEKSVILTR